MFDFLISLGLFYCAILLVPALLISYVVLKISHAVWLFAISILHPQVEFFTTTSVRTLLDTHRNQGIISILLAVKGQAQPEAIRRHLQEIVKRRNKSGNLTFPRLRHCLVARCGTYAWQRGKFDLDQNLTIAPVSYKGRAVTEYNIQEYVSEIVSKYLPIGIPPWQVIIIPSSEDHHYILVKLHHVLLTEGLNIGDLLPLIPPTRPPSSVSSYISKSPLVNVVPKPEALLKLKERITEELANRWNEFISNYDPLECPQLLKTNPSLYQFLAISLVTLVSTLKECRKGFKVIRNDLFSYLTFVLKTLQKEAGKRQVNLKTFFISVLVLLDPRNLLIWIWSCTRFFALLPVTLIARIGREIGALYTCITMHYCTYNQTLIGALYDYVPLVYNSLAEILSYFKDVFYGPKTLVSDILCQKESFQTITLCGRKSVAWSDPVKLDLIKDVSKSTNVSETEVCLAAISGCISRYFIQTKHLIPDDLSVTLRNISSNYVFATGRKVKPEDSINGILCLNLPILDPEKEASLLENLVDIKRNFRESLDRQKLPYFLSLMQTKFGILTKFLPLSLLGIYLRYLSRKYAIIITEITSRYPNVTQRTIWGQEVSSVIYFRPPQANSSVSLCLNEYADHIKLGVMCDSQLAPQHAVLARCFPEYVQELARSTGITLQH